MNSVKGEKRDRAQEVGVYRGQNFTGDLTTQNKGEDGDKIQGGGRVETGSPFWSIAKAKLGSRAKYDKKGLQTTMGVG